MVLAGQVRRGPAPQRAQQVLCSVQGSAEPLAVCACRLKAVRCFTLACIGYTRVQSAVMYRPSVRQLNTLHTCVLRAVLYRAMCIG
eukprot:3844365-Rhodomonas_salina.1